MQNETISTTEATRIGQSLPWAIEAIARRAGYAVDHDDLMAALGLSLMVCCPCEESDVAAWSMYGRDVFLGEAARLYGMEVREIHPPEAARGLNRSAEFEQHFEASYRPLIDIALQNSQPVLAWQGWSMGGALQWGVIRESCEGGVGFIGTLHGPHPTGDEIECIVQRPPVQFYVIESLRPAVPDPEALLACALGHARRVLDNAIDARYGVRSGLAAYDAWEAQVSTPGAAVLAGAVAEGHKSAIRFLERYRSQPTSEDWLGGEVLIRCCRTTHLALRPWIEGGASGIQAGLGSDRLAQAIRAARSEAMTMRCALNAYPQEMATPNI